MADFIYSGNTKEMYNSILELSPKPFREMTKKQMDKALTDSVGDGGEITEEKMMEIVKATTPKAFLPMALKVLEPMLTKK